MVILYDPVQTANGQLTMKAYRLSKAFMRVYREKKNEVIKPSEILEELPIKIRNPGIINALIFDLQVCAAWGEWGGAWALACLFVGGLYSGWSPESESESESAGEQRYTRPPVSRLSSGWPKTRER